MLATVWIPDFFLSLATRHRRGKLLPSVILLDGVDGTVVGLSAAVRELGVALSMKEREARALAPEAQVLYQDRTVVERALGDLLLLFESFTPDIELLGPGKFLLNLGQTSRDEAQKILSAIRQRMQLEASLGMAASRWVSEVAAQDAKSGQVLWVSPGDEERFMASHPVEVLPVSQRCLDQLALLGLKTLAQVARIPEKDLRRQFREEACLIQDCLKGRDSQPTYFPKAEEVYEGCLEYEVPVEPGEWLYHEIFSQLDRLFMKLKEDHKLATLVHLCFRCESGTPLKASLSLSSPSGDVSRLQGLLSERLRDVRLPARLQSLSLALDGLVAEYARQLDFTDCLGTAEKHRRIRRVMDRMEARGRGQHLLQVVWNDPDNRLPERRAYLQDILRPPIRRGLCLPRPAKVLCDPSGVPHMLRTRQTWRSVDTVVEAWELEDEWWQNRPVMRRYFRLLLQDGGIYRVFFDRVNGQWYQQTR